MRHFNFFTKMGCCMSQPPPTDGWIGTWEGEGVTMTVEEDGTFSWRDEKEYWSGYILAYGEYDNKTKFLRAGGCFNCCGSRMFLVQKEPVEEAGNWHQKTASKEFYADVKWRAVINKKTLVKK